MQMSPRIARSPLSKFGRICCPNRRKLRPGYSCILPCHSFNHSVAQRESAFLLQMVHTSLSDKILCKVSIRHDTSPPCLFQPIKSGDDRSPTTHSTQRCQRENVFSQQKPENQKVRPRFSHVQSPHRSRESRVRSQQGPALSRLLHQRRQD